MEPMRDNSVRATSERCIGEIKFHRDALNEYKSLSEVPHAELNSRLNLIEANMEKLLDSYGTNSREPPAALNKYMTRMTIANDHDKKASMTGTEQTAVVMGDVISILKHSKTLLEQITDQTLTAPKSQEIRVKPVVRVTTTEASAPTRKPLAPSRRVLPEHEGKYKVSLPKGSTAKTRAILAKRSEMKSDRIERKSIFERLNSSRIIDLEAEPEMKSSKPSSSSSIFNRLGDYKELQKKGFKAPSIKIGNAVSMRETFKPKDTERSIKLTDDKMDVDKSVSFSPEVQVRVFSSDPIRVPAQKKFLKIDGMKTRLEKTGSSAMLHKTIKSGSMKPIPMMSLKSDFMKAKEITVHSRLDVNNRNSKPVGSSVFNRLGRND